MTNEKMDQEGEWFKRRCTKKPCECSCLTCGSLSSQPLSRGTGRALRMVGMVVLGLSTPGSWQRHQSSWGFSLGKLLSAVLVLVSASFFYCIPGPPECCWAGDGLCVSLSLGAVAEISSLFPFGIFCFPGLVNSIYSSVWFSSLVAAVGFCPLCPLDCVNPALTHSEDLKQ